MKGRGRGERMVGGERWVRIRGEGVKRLESKGFAGFEGLIGISACFAFYGVVFLKVVSSILLRDHIIWLRDDHENTRPCSFHGYTTDCLLL